MTPCTDDHAETLLNLYVDGELPSSRQAMLFAHLAACPGCRSQFNALLAFRLAVRQEVLTVPPAVDEAFFARIDRLRRAAHPAPDRAAARGLFGDTLRRRVPVGLAAAVTVLLVTLGLLARPMPPAAEAVPSNRLTEVVTDDGNALYVMDGITVEVSKSGRPAVDG